MNKKEKSKDIDEFPKGFSEEFRSVRFYSNINGVEKEYGYDYNRDKEGKEEYREIGYWTQEEFMPSCGIWIEGQQRLDGKKLCRFRGLIASGRTITRDWGKCTLICLGVENRRYIDLVLPEEHRGDLFKWAALEGTGVLTKLDTVEVTKISGVALSKLCY